MTKEIKLTKNQVALVDDEWFDYLNQWSWYAAKWRGNYYAVRRDPATTKGGKRPMVPMHRVIAGAPDGNNTRRNLRVCSPSKNQVNKPLDRRNKTGYKGVCQDKKTGEFIAQIGHNRTTIKLGKFADPIEAARAYDRKARELFGDFAWLNFPSPTRSD
jgi:hypothetical protein